ncbi:hypothetical protein [Streptomyces sp. NPDC000618]|uniref:DUF4760 domain-containing protein n=1 Tax=Streptomyces sp. NPDC000618 TaxID=3154265 RepID=UPI0033344BD2
MGYALAIASVAVAFLAMVIAFLALWWSRRTWRASVEQNRRDMFLGLHEKLSSAEQQTGRRFLREKIGSLRDAEVLRREDPNCLRQVVGALAMLDILGLYVEKGFVDKELVFEEWGSLLAELHPHGVHVIEERRQNRGSGRKLWPHFRRLALEAATWVERQDQL